MIQLIILVNLLSSLATLEIESRSSGIKHIVTSRIRKCKNIRFAISSGVITRAYMYGPLMEKVKSLTFHMQKSYAWHNFEVRLRDIDFWKHGDKILINHDYRITLQRFATYIKNHFYHSHHHHPAFLFLNEKDNSGKGILGIANTGTECSMNSASLIWFPTHMPSYELGITLAHELGHILGLPHQEVDKYCECAFGHRCVMVPAAFEWDPPDLQPPFDTCSIQKLINYVVPCEENCGHIKDTQAGTATQKYFSDAFGVCGNGVIDGSIRDECDCGPTEVCYARDLHKCCDGLSCKLRKGSKCSVEECCENCQPKRGLKCRGKRDRYCDLSEFCVGDNIHCNTDTHVRNGEPCLNGYCFDGRCTDRDNLCQTMLHDPSARYSAICEHLFKKYSKSNRCHSGNINNHQYHKRFECSFNVECNPIVCETYNKVKVTTSIFRFVLKSGRVIVCHFHKDVEYNEIRGLPCGNDRVCINGRCTHKALYVLRCPICRPNHICNNHGKCVPNK